MKSKVNPEWLREFVSPENKLVLDYYEKWFHGGHIHLELMGNNWNVVSKVTFAILCESENLGYALQWLTEAFDKIQHTPDAMMPAHVRKFFFMGLLLGTIKALNISSKLNEVIPFSEECLGEVKNKIKLHQTPINIVMSDISHELQYDIYDKMNDSSYESELSSEIKRFVCVQQYYKQEELLLLLNPRSTTGKSLGSIIQDQINYAVFAAQGSTNQRVKVLVKGLSAQ